MKYATSNSPYTILVYGNGVGPYQGITTYTGNDGDGIIPHSHATILEDLLNPTSSQVGGGTGDNASQIIEGENCTLFKLFGVGYGDFGVENRVHPNTTMQECELKDVIKEYYKTIPEQLN